MSDRIALDVMGGDHAPEAILAGAVKACGPEGRRQLDPSRVLLVGDEERIRPALAQLGAPEFEILHASQVIGMDEKPAVALRAKQDSSISRCVGAIKTGAAGALVSMGNTGAVVGASTLGLGTLEGVRRPAIAVTLDLTGTSPVTLLDMGANIAPKPEHLRQYGVMGSIFTRDVLDQDNPRVGLLNIGEEASKGTDLLREAHTLLSSSDVAFVGNLEGGDIFHDRAEVIVTDGFTGNVVLKLLEDFAAFMMQLVMGELTSHGVKWGPEALGKIKKRIDYSEYGGALLLGVAGIVIIGHGRSDATAVNNALHLAARALDKDVNGDIVDGLTSAAKT